MDAASSPMMLEETISTRGSTSRSRNQANLPLHLHRSEVVQGEGVRTGDQRAFGDSVDLSANHTGVYNTPYINRIERRLFVTATQPIHVGDLQLQWRVTEQKARGKSCQIGGIAV